MKKKRVSILNEIPDGWGYIKNAMTAPVGYRWICNKKSRFSGDYESALLKERNPTT
jgi:hypothetical protein